MNKTILLLMIFILVPFTLGYDYVGQNDFRLGTGIFNENLLNHSTATRTITTPLFSPLVADLDNDSINEIIVFDSPHIRLYHNSDLEIIDAYSFSIDVNQPSNIIIFDIDNDGYKEIIMGFGDAEQLKILEYNGTSFHNQTTLYWSNTASESYEGEVLIHCGGVENCLISWIKSDISFGGSLPDIATITPFNSTNMGTADYFSTINTPPQVLCYSTIKNMDYKDYDNDGDSEYIISMINGNTDGAESIKILFVGVNNTFGAEIETTHSVTTGDLAENGGSLVCSTDLLNKYFTSPLTFDWDGSSSNGLETVFGYMVDDNEFVMHSIDKNGNFIDDYPETFEADGEIVSNIMRVNSFTDTGAVDFCVMGYQQSDGQLDLLCASEQTGQVPETDEFFSDTSYNVSLGHNDYKIMTHTGQHSSVTEDGNNLDEIINSYGVFRLDYTLINELELIFENPKADAVVITSDVEGAGLEDMIALTSTNLWYINDGFTKTGAGIDEYTINPCIDSVWEVDVNGSNTAEVTITATDPESDDVSVRAVLYSNETNEQNSGWSVNVSSGTTVPFEFVVNETITAGKLLLYARDTSNPEDIASIELTYTVGTDGVVKGECITTVTGIVADEEAEEDDTEISEGDLEDLGDEVAETFGIEAKYQIFLGLLIIIFSIFGTFYFLSQYGIKSGAVMLYAPMGMGVIAWIFCVAIGWIPAWTVIISILLFSAVIGFKVYRGDNSNGGM